MNRIVDMEPSAGNQLVVDTVTETIGQILEGVQERVKRVAPPTELFHFTDTDGTIGILKTGAFWASLSTALNDASEERYAVEMAKTLIGTSTFAVPKGDFLDAVVRFLDDPTLLPQFFLRANAFVVSFCSDVDSAAQWLHYGKQGSGMALCFEGQQLATTSNCDLLRILYKPQEQADLLTWVVRTAHSRVTDIESKLSTGQFTVLTNSVAHLVAQTIRIVVSAQIKAPAFSHENEWRLVTFEFEPARLPERLRSKTNEVFYRSRNSRLVPYLKMPLSTPLPLTKVVLGHSNPMEDSEAALQLLWQQTVNDSPRVIRSPIAVRP